MKENARPRASLAPGFRHLLLAGAISAFLLIVLGILLRVSQTGSACPDWPTCFGGWSIAPGENALIPLLHRLVAVVTGLIVLTGTVWAWRAYRSLPAFPLLLSAALGVLIVQGILGRGVVRWEEPLWAVPLHLALALGVQALLIAAAVLAFYKRDEAGFLPRFVFLSPFARQTVWVFSLTFILFVSGSLVTASGATGACSGWPLCNGSILPAAGLAWIEFVHRLVAVIAGVVTGWLVLRAWQTQRSQAPILVSATVAGVLFFAQVFLGFFETASRFPDYLRGLHVATAAGVWVALVVVVVLSGLANRSAQDERAEAAGFGRRRGLLKDFLALTKPVVVALLLVTTFAGMVVGAQSWPAWNVAFWTLLAGFMAAGGSEALNQYIDRFDDIKMQRTSRRPIPSGRLTPAEGLAFGAALCLASFYLMVAFVNFTAALLVLAGIVYYVLIYSILLKKATVQNIVIGGGAGAIPPLVGWAAATGSLNLPALFLFAVVFMWTPPHFWALALVRSNDYARAGIPMLPVVRGERETRWQIFLYTLELVALTLALPLVGLGGSIYLVAALALGGALIYVAWKVWRGSGNKVAWMMYRYSSMYLAFLFLALMVDALL